MKTGDFLSLHKKHSTARCCVYFLRNGNDVVYIGCTKSPYKRIYLHSRSDKVFDNVSMMICDEREMINLEGEMIRKYLPIYNKRIPLPDDGDKNKKVTIEVDKLTRAKLKAVSDKRKKDGKYPNKQIEILTDYINKLHDKECK